MKLLNTIVKERNVYADRLEQIAEQVDVWLNDISKEKRLGLKPMDQLITEADPYNTADKNSPTGSTDNDTVEFTPTNEPIEKPVQTPSAGNTEPMRVHLIYDPATGEIVKTLKTPMRSRPPAEYMEATADQVSGALRHLEKMNPHLADLLVSGRMNVWIPRAKSNMGPSSVKHLGLAPVETRGNSNKMTLSPEQLAAARAAAGKMKVA